MKRWRGRFMGEETLAELERRAAGGDHEAQLALADALDAAGRHADAINVLSRAARLGNAVAKGRVGARLIIGDRAPAMPADGARLIAEAAAEGSGEASALAAVLAAAGIYRSQSWPDALDLLLRAAEQGYKGARGQLAVFGGDPALVEEARDADAPAPALWGKLRASVDVGELVAAPPGRTLNEDPLIRAFRAFASEAVCDWLVARARPKLARAQVYNPAQAHIEANETRTNTIAAFSLVDTDVVNIVIQTRMAAAADVAFANMEPTAVLHYEVGEEFVEHYDFIDPNAPNYAQEIARNGERIITFLLYLNDDYEGGETEFTRLGFAHKGEKGEGLYFTNALASGKPDERMAHAGLPPTSGEKWVVSQFIRNRQAVPGVRA